MQEEEKVTSLLAIAKSHLENERKASVTEDGNRLIAQLYSAS
jgi:hypothetical protein